MINTTPPPPTAPDPAQTNDHGHDLVVAPSQVECGLNRTTDGDPDNSVDVPKTERPSASIRRAPSPPPDIPIYHVKTTTWLRLIDPDPKKSPEKPKRTVCPGMKVMSQKSKRKQQISPSSWFMRGVAPSSQSTAGASAATTSAGRSPLMTSEMAGGVRRASPGEDSEELNVNSNSRMCQKSKDLKCMKVRADGLAIALKEASNAWGPGAKMTSPGGSEDDPQ